MGVVGPNGSRQLYLEKVPGFARIILQQFKIHPGDAFLIFSSTGINGTVVEMALLAKAMRLPVVAVTSLQHTQATPSRHPSGKKLADPDITIDNCSPPGDAATDIEGIPFRVGPVSSIGAIAVVNALKTRTAELLVAHGVVPTVLTSPHFVAATWARLSWSVSTRSTSDASGAPTTRMAPSPFRPRTWPEPWPTT